MRWANSTASVIPTILVCSARLRSTTAWKQTVLPRSGAWMVSMASSVSAGLASRGSCVRLHYQHWGALSQAAVETASAPAERTIATSANVIPATMGKSATCSTLLVRSLFTVETAAILLLYSVPKPTEFTTDLTGTSEATFSSSAATYLLPVGVTVGVVTILGLVAIVGAIVVAKLYTTKRQHVYEDVMNGKCSSTQENQL